MALNIHSIKSASPLPDRIRRLAREVDALIEEAKESGPPHRVRMLAVARANLLVGAEDVLVAAPLVPDWASD